MADTQDTAALRSPPRPGPRGGRDVGRGDDPARQRSAERIGADVAAQCSWSFPTAPQRVAGPRRRRRARPVRSGTPARRRDRDWPRPRALRARGRGGRDRALGPAARRRHGGRRRRCARPSRDASTPVAQPGELAASGQGLRARPRDQQGRDRPEVPPRRARANLREGRLLAAPSSSRSSRPPVAPAPPADPHPDEASTSAPSAASSAPQARRVSQPSVSSITPAILADRRPIGRLTGCFRGCRGAERLEVGRPGGERLLDARDPPRGGSPGLPGSGSRSGAGEGALRGDVARCRSTVSTTTTNAGSASSPPTVGSVRVVASRSPGSRCRSRRACRRTRGDRNAHAASVRPP